MESRKTYGDYPYLDDPTIYHQNIPDLDENIPFLGEGGGRSKSLTEPVLLLNFLDPLW